MKRYFYTDPLAAAWMAKHYGMSFEGCGHGAYTSAPIHPNADPDLFPEDDCRYYIHPDSLHLLEPIPTSESADGYVEHDLCHARRGDRNFYGTYHECLGFCDAVGEITIVQHDGKPFHWPESEEANEH